MNNIVDMVLAALPWVLGIGAVGGLVAKLLSILKEISELLLVVVDALADKNLTKDEIANIIKEAKDVAFAVKALGTK